MARNMRCGFGAIFGILGLLTVSLGLSGCGHASTGKQSVAAKSPTTSAPTFVFEGQHVFTRCAKADINACTGYVYVPASSVQVDPGAALRGSSVVPLLVDGRVYMTPAPLDTYPRNSMILYEHDPRDGWTGPFVWSPSWSSPPAALFPYGPPPGCETGPVGGVGGVGGPGGC